MREAGVTMVSVGIFSCALLEPAPGQYDFGWLDQVVELLHDNDIRVDLATPTVVPSPPRSSPSPSKPSSPARC